MKKLFLFFFILFAAMDSSAIGLTENNSFNKSRLQKKAGVGSSSVVNNSILKLPVSDDRANKEKVRVSKTISTSIVGLISGFFSKVFSIFFRDYMDLSLDGKKCIPTEKC